MATRVFGVEIELDDHASKVAADATLGLYNITSALGATASAAASSVTVADGTIFAARSVATIADDNDSETIHIDYISGDVLYLVEVLVNTYTQADNGRVDANSKFRWIQNEISGVSNWSHTMLSEQGIAPFSREIDLSSGGNISSPGKSSISIKNTSQFQDSLDTKTIFLNGAKATIYEFLDAVKYPVWSGVCDLLQWSAAQYTIPLRGNLNQRRTNLGTLISKATYPDAPSGTSGSMMPLTYGELRPTKNEDGIDTYSLARFVHTAKKQKAYRNTHKRVLMTNSDPNLTLQLEIGSQYFRDLQAFPVVDTESNGTFNVMFGTYGMKWTRGDGSTATGSFILDYFENMYVKIVLGSGDSAKSVGHIKKLSAVKVTMGTTDNLFELTVDDLFPSPPTGNITATHADQCWVSIVEDVSDYRCDVWPCRNYIDIDGDTHGLVGSRRYIDWIDLFVKGNNSLKEGYNDTDLVVSPAIYDRLPCQTFDDLNDGNNNHLIILPRLLFNDIDKALGTKTLPVQNVKLYGIEPTLVNFGYGGYKKRYEGLYSSNIGSVGSLVFNAATTDLATACTDRVHTTYAEYANEIFSGHKSFTAVEFQLPEFPVDLNFDKIHILLYITRTQTGVLFGVYKMFWDRFIGTAVESMSNENAIILRGFPDEYFATDRGLRNQYFFTETNSIALRYGFKNFEIAGITNKDIYETAERFVMLFHNDGVSGTNTDTIKFYQIAVMFSKSYSIGDKIYSPMQGRTTGGVNGDSWQGRKSPGTALIESPLEVLEHVCRLQNYSDIGKAPTLGWGKDYSSDALINISIGSVVTTVTNTIQVNTVAQAKRFRPRQQITISDGTNREIGIITSITANVLILESALSNSYSSGSVWADGCFDNPELISWSDPIKLARQITDQNAAYSDEMKRSLCRDMFLMNWVDRNGFECVKRIVKEEITPIDTVTLADIVDRESIIVHEPDPSDVYAEPFVSYQFDNDTGKPQKAIRITNADAESFSTSYVDGWTGASAEEYWDRCKILYKRVHEIGKPSKSITDLLWCNGIYADNNAIDNLKARIDWMYNPTIEFSVHYTKAYLWEEGHQFIINLPHQTDAADIECVLTGITIDPNPPYLIRIKAIMFKETIPDDFDIQDVTYLFGDSHDWIDNTTEYGNDNDKIDVS